MNTKTLKKIGIEALMGFILWTIILTPYMLFVTKMTVEQYITWLAMEVVMVPPIAIFVVNITNRVVRRFIK